MKVEGFTHEIRVEKGEKKGRRTGKTTWRTSSFISNLLFATHATSINTNNGADGKCMVVVL